MSNDEILKNLVGRVIEIVREREEDWPWYAAFDVPGADHEARLAVSKETRMRIDSWLLTAGVVQKGGDRLHSHFLCHGDGQEGKEKIRDYLARSEFEAEFIASVKELSAHVEQDD